MRPVDLIKMVGANLTRARFRVALSAFGVLIGIAAVVILVSVSSGMQRFATQNIFAIGPLNEITVTSTSYSLGGMFVMTYGGSSPSASEKLTPALLAELEARPEVKAVTPKEPMYQGQIKYKHLIAPSLVYGVDPEALGRFDLDLQSGTLDLGRMQAVVGAAVGESFFDPRRSTRAAPSADHGVDMVMSVGGPMVRAVGPDSPGAATDAIDLLDRTLTLTLTRTAADGTTLTRTVRVHVVGVLEPRGGEYDYGVFIRMPDYEELNTWLNGKRINRRREGYYQAVVLAESVDDVPAITEDLKNRGLMAFSSQEVVGRIQETFSIVQVLVGGIGFITLAIAGTGIANTLVTAIYERTREIGLMKAVGATDGQVMSVFLAEAGVIGGVGGLGGLLLGWAVTQAIDLVFRQTYAMGLTAGDSQAWMALPGWLYVLAPLFAVAMGVAAGFLPARRAASLNPVVALR